MDSHLEADYEDRNGDPIGIVTFDPEWFEEDEYEDSLEEEDSDI